MTTFLKPRSVATNRDKLLTAAELAIVEKGFAATSIEELITEVGITKSGFFYHFRDKSEMVKALLERHLAEEAVWFEGLFARASTLDDDPLHAFLIFLRLLQEDMERLTDVHPGCIVTACVFQERLFDRSIHELAADSLLGWRRQFHAKFKEIAAVYPPRIDVDLEDLSDMLTVVTDGGIILSKTIRDKGVLARQVGLYRKFVKSIFAPRH
ncbi:MAG: TetR/AcrR family transcriptional regulator [Pseudomonadota bacterium]